MSSIPYRGGKSRCMVLPHEELRLDRTPRTFESGHFRKINLSHLALGLMIGIAVLPIFGADRPMFWRESASGVRVSAFFLARVTVSGI